jgi:hypothetical protein
VLTYRTRPSEMIMSIADQYILRLGVGWVPDRLAGLGMSVGFRVDGVPVRDLIGASNGFRRPGFGVSVEPGVRYGWGKSVVSVSVPVMLHRNRQRSVPDIMDGMHGDAAFADFLISAAYVHTF